MAKKKKSGFKVVSYEETNPKRTGKSGEYDEILEAVGDLEEDQALLLDVPEDVKATDKKTPAEVYRNRISSAIRHHLEAPEGFRFRCEVQEDETQVAVRLQAKSETEGE